MHCVLSFHFLFFFIWYGVVLFCPGWSAVVWSRLTATSHSWVHMTLVPHLSSSWDYRLLLTCPAKFLYIRFFFWRRSLWHPGLECSSAILAYYNFHLPSSSDSCASSGRHHTQLIFVFSVETRILHVGKAGLELSSWGTSSSHSPKVLYFRRELQHSSSPRHFGFLFFFFFQVGSCLCWPGWRADVWYQLNGTSVSWVQAILLPQPPK